MEADWYVDPLGRFDGRFFDGESWTERVSDNGTAAIDPDFSSTTVAAIDESDLLDQPMQAAGAPAATPLHLGASLMEESSARVVAVLDPSVVGGPSVEGGSRAPVLWGLLALIAALAVAVLLLWDHDRSGVVAVPVELDQEQEARVQDLEEGGIIGQVELDAIEALEVEPPSGSIGQGAGFATSETIEVGSLRVLNGTRVLDELGIWHQQFAVERGVVLDETASCWFGQLGDAAVQVVHCGPVGGSANTEFLFDAVPLLFEDIAGGQIAQPVVDAVQSDAVLANALTLVSNRDNPPPLRTGG